MKSIITLFGLLILIQAQSQDLVNDQNPNFSTSLNKYLLVEDSLQSYMNTTVQQTYKAYDWYQAKQERRQNRINTRQQIRINRSMNNFGFNNGWNNDFNNGWNNNQWNGFNNNRWNNNRFIPNSIGFRTGNWWFFF